MTDKLVIVGLLWAGYCIVHSVLAATSFKSRVQLIFKKKFKYYRLFYNLYAVAMLVIIIIYQLSFASPLIFIPNLITKISGATITVIGVWIMGICIAKYFKQESGFLWMNPEMPAQKTELHISGIHNYVRHPLYLGTFVFIWGLFILFPSAANLVAVSIITIYTLISIRFEEKKLIAEFGDAYKEYKRKVPMIIPKFKNS
ncbi:MAG TPA: isoprenylcysteine carboxylmethyltransferase family protein [Chitinophagaceae bacterium]|nr:isoprenylcysteine carboxylmethyltransferase family protein [Chitinophagaceae bacterium]